MREWGWGLGLDRDEGNVTRAEHVCKYARRSAGRMPAPRVFAHHTHVCEAFPAPQKNYSRGRLPDQEECSE